jgi:hypothetical protein
VDGAPVTVRLDDPVAGPPLGTVPATGVRDVYVVFEEAGATVSVVELAPIRPAG